MRVLEFDVYGNEIKQNSQCDFGGIKRNPGSIMAKVNLSKEWSGHKIVISFFKLGEEFPVALRNGSCMIPQKAMSWKEFAVQIVGVKDGTVIKTNKLSVTQEG